MRVKKPLRPAAVSLVLGTLLFAWLSVPLAGVAADPTTEPRMDTDPSAVASSFESALVEERSELEEMEQNLQRWKVLKDRTVNEIAAYRIQNSAHENLLLARQTRVEALEAALNSSRLATQSLVERIDAFERIESIAADWMSQLTDRTTIAEKRLTEIEQGTTPADESRNLRQKLHHLLDLLHDKKQRGERFIDDFSRLFDRLKKTVSDLKETQGQLEKRLRSQERSKLFERDLRPLEMLGVKRLMSEQTAAWDLLRGLLRAEYWQGQWATFQGSVGITQAIFLTLFLLFVIVSRKVGRFLQSIAQQLQLLPSPARQLAVTMVDRSLLLIGAAVFLWIYDLLKLPHVNYHLARLLSQTVFTLLLARWGIDYLKLRADGSDSHLRRFTSGVLVQGIRTVRPLIIVYFFFIPFYGGESLSTWIFRLAVEGALLIWGMLFWRAFDRRVAVFTRRGEAAPAPLRYFGCRVWSYLVFGGALLMDIIGYQALAAHWLVSWAETVALLVWAKIGWMSIREWHHQQSLKTDRQAGGTAPMVAAPVGWFMVQMARLLWAVALLAGVLTAWAGSEFMVEAMQRLVELEFSVGSVKIGVNGVLLAVVILYLTHVATRIGRRLLSEKVLDARDFERGLKESIVTISTYVIWGLGILMALSVVGVNATSLAVVFGALSIGIGFGLQNIFNNFISGLILLFERPIQVGDYVEINGLWAEVKNINVRATIVQTFDNATVIIPNSDFISQQVTNWSFKDPRMRRHVNVGVAYGSDIEKVRQTLLEIPDDIPQILKYPRPDVLFLDHGDSALIFRLRFWVHVDHYFSSTTAARFELDRRFRALGIEIAYPQMDLHIRSDHRRPSAEVLEASPGGPQADDAVDRSKTDPSG